MERPAFHRIMASTIVSGECLLSTLRVDRYGYACIRDTGRNRNAHRVVAEVLWGPIPSGLQVHHECRVKRCVNPAHLKIVTHQVNSTIDGTGPASINAMKLRCVYGHSLIDPLNVRFHPRKGTADRLIRVCRACDRRRHAKMSAKRRQS